MTINRSPYLRVVAAVLLIGALSLFFQALRTSDGRLIVGSGAVVLALVAVAVRMWQQKLIINSTGLTDTRIFGRRSLDWADIESFYLDRPLIAGGLCVWVVCHDGTAFSLHSTWRTDRAHDRRSADVLLAGLGAALAANRGQ